MAVARNGLEIPHRISLQNAFWVGILGLVILTGATARAQNLPAKISSLNQQLRSQSSPAAVTRLLQQRRAAVEQLMRESPGSVRSVMLKAGDLGQMLTVAPEAESLVEKEGEWSGPLELLAEDDFDHHRSLTHWRVRTSAGPVELYFAHGAPSIKPRCSPRVTVAGIGTSDRVAVDAVTALSNTPPVCSTMDDQHIAVILLTMPSARTFPSGFDASYFQHLFFGNTGYTLNNYWQESSYGEASATGQVFGPFALNADYSCNDNDNLAAAAIQAASSVDFTQFERVALVFPVQTCSYGGLGTIGCWETLVPMQNISISWLPVFPYQDTSNYIGAVAHELGHNLGLNHSNTLDYGSVAAGAFDDSGSNTEYGDPFSVMGQVWTADGPQKIFGQYDAPHKSLDLGWLDLKDGGYEEVAGSGSFTLLPFEASRGLRALRVLRDAATGGWMWLEYRQPQGQVDSTFSFLTNINEPATIFEGALIHVETPGLDPLHTYLLDFHAVAQPNDFYNAPLTAGESWSDPYSPLTLSVSKADANGLAATVTYDPPCATLSLSGSPFAAGGGSGSIAVTAPSSCNWTALTRTSWITLTGSTSGHGNGAVNFTVAASPGGTLQRNGFITVQRQSVQVIEAGTGPLVLSASPVFGAGTSVRMTVSFRNPRGFANISSASVVLSNPAGSSLDACSMFIDRAAGTVALLNDSGTQYSTPLNLTQAGTSTANSQCTLAATGSSITGSGNNLQVTLQLAFDPTFVGAHSVVASVSDTTTGSSNPIQVATWVVPVNSTGAPAALASPSSLAFGNRPLGSQSSPSPVTITNSGTALLHISSITISGVTGFAQSNDCGSTLAVGDSCTVQVTFSPASTGSASASLLITDDAVGSPQSVSLTGSGGSIPVAAVNPVSLIFAGQEIGTHSPASGISYSNTGGAPLAITDIAITGNHPGDFSQTNDCGSTLAAGTSCHISVVFSPSNGGGRLGTLLISDNAAGSPHAIGLSGTGSDFEIGSFDREPVSTVSAGQTATYHLQINPENGFTGQVTIACSDPVPFSTCTPSQSGSLSVSGSPVDFAVQVTTKGPTATATNHTGRLPGGSLPWSMAALVVGFCVCSRRTRWKAGIGAALLIVCMGMTSCGGGGGGGGGSNPAPSATPAGTYQITVNASFSGVTHPFFLTLKVQ